MVISVIHLLLDSFVKKSYDREVQVYTHSTENMDKNT